MCFIGFEYGNSVSLPSGTVICFSNSTGCFIFNNAVDLNETIIYNDTLYFRNLYRPKIYNVTSPSSWLKSFCFPWCNITAPLSNTTIHFFAEDSSVSLTSSLGWSVTEGQSTTITCTANGNVTSTLYKNGITVSSPYSATLSYGTYNFTCAINDTTGRFTPISSQKSLSVSSSGLGCTNTDTYAFQKTIETSGELLNLNFTDLVKANYVRSDLRDVVNSTSLKGVWTNYTNGETYLILNVSGVSSATIKFGNYIGNKSYSNTTTISDNTTQMDSYEESYYYYFFNFYNEKTASQWMPTNVNRTLSLYCDDGESTFSFNHTKVLIATVEPIDEAKATIGYSATSFYYRNLLYSSDVEFRKMYLVDATENTVLQIVLTMQDLTGDFDNAKLRIKKNIESNLETITELNFDAENKAIIYLVDGDKYTVTIDNDIEERTIGYLYADSSDLTKTLVVGYVNYTDLSPGNVSLNLTFGSIHLTWNDPSNKTNSVSMWVYNVTTNDLLYSATSDNASFVSFVYAVPDDNATYKVRYEVDHDILGVFGATVFMNGEGYKTIPTSFPLSDLITGLGGSSNVWLALLLILPIPFMFTKRFAAVGAVAMLLIFLLLDYWNVINISTKIIIPIAGLIAAIMFVRWMMKEDKGG